MSDSTIANGSLALLEISNLAPAFIAADVCAKAADVHVLGIESTDGEDQCIKLVGATAAVSQAAQDGLAAAQRMGANASLSVIPAPTDAMRALAQSPPIYNPQLENYDHRTPGTNPMSNESEAIGFLETQGLVGALHATDDMLKASNVALIGKEKIGAAYVTIMIRGDVASVQTAIDAGKRTVERLGGKLIMADVIARPHPELVALLPTS